MITAKPEREIRWTGTETSALSYMAKTRRRFLGILAWTENLSAEDREMRPVYISTHIAVLREIALAFPDRTGQVETLIGKLEAVKRGERPGV